MSKLEQEKNILIRDNITLKIEVEKLLNIINMLEEEYENGISLKSKYLNMLDENDLNTFEKKIYNIKQTQIVTEQSLLSMQIVIKNNAEIIRNIEQIQNVTIIALNSAVMVAKSLYKQKIVLKNMNKLNKTGENVSENAIKYLDKQNVSNYLQENFSNVLNTIKAGEDQYRKNFPENEIRISELKNGGNL